MWTVRASSLQVQPNGVFFDIGAIGKRLQISWTSETSTKGWLALDRNGNGQIDDGTELFGDVTPQPKPPKRIYRNGYLALAEFDNPQTGGMQMDTLTDTTRSLPDY